MPHKSQALFLDTQVSSMEVARELKLRRREGELVDFGDQSLTGGQLLIYTAINCCGEESFLVVIHIWFLVLCILQKLNKVCYFTHKRYNIFPRNTFTPRLPQTELTVAHKVPISQLLSPHGLAPCGSVQI